MPKIDVEHAPSVTGSGYPEPFDEPCKGRSNLRLGTAAGLTQLGVNLTTLAPGAWSSQRHWHALEDELVYVLEGEVVLIEDGGEQLLGPGDCAGWKAGVRNGHHLVNRSERDVRLLTIGNRNDDDHGEYSDIDLKFHPNRYTTRSHYTRKDGSEL